MKTKVIERNKAKLESAEEDVKDLYTEFELERQDYLATIRQQDRTMKLYEQLLETVVPCLRRDCNYFNMDKVRAECKWNEGKDRWDVPKLTVNKTLLAQTSPLLQQPLPQQPPPTTLPKGAGHRVDRRAGPGPGGKGTTPVHQSSSRHSSLSDGSVRGAGVGGSSSSLLRGGGGGPHHHHGHASSSAFPNSNSCDNLEDGDRFGGGHFALKSDDSFDYFKPKRALELISHHNSSSSSSNNAYPSPKEGVSPIHATTATSDVGSKSTLPNAAAVHGVEPPTNYGRRLPGKLQSLGGSRRNPPQVPISSTMFQQQQQQHQETDLLDKVDKKLASRARKGLEPLADIKTKR